MNQSSQAEDILKDARCECAIRPGWVREGGLHWFCSNPSRRHAVCSASGRDLDNLILQGKEEPIHYS